MASISTVLDYKSLDRHFQEHLRVQAEERRRQDQAAQEARRTYAMLMQTNLEQRIETATMAVAQAQSHWTWRVDDRGIPMADLPEPPKIIKKAKKVHNTFGGYLRSLGVL